MSTLGCVNPSGARRGRVAEDDYRRMDGTLVVEARISCTREYMDSNKCLIDTHTHTHRLILFLSPFLRLIIVLELGAKLRHISGSIFLVLGWVTRPRWVAHRRAAVF